MLAGSWAPHPPKLKTYNPAPSPSPNPCRFECFPNSASKLLVLDSPSTVSYSLTRRVCSFLYLWCTSVTSSLIDLCSPSPEHVAAVSPRCAVRHQRRQDTTVSAIVRDLAILAHHPSHAPSPRQRALHATASSRHRQDCRHACMCHGCARLGRVAHMGLPGRRLCGLHERKSSPKNYL